MAGNRFLPKLSQNLLEILNDEEYHDITIEVGIDPYVKIFRAHMNILNYRSPHLRRILSTNKKKNDGTLVQIKLPNILPETFQIILRYIYGGELSLKEYDTSDIVKILVAANELSLQELVDYLQSFLTENKANWVEQNFTLVYQTSFENDSFLELQKSCTDLITKEPVKIFKSLDFSLIPEKLLVTLIQSDNLQMSEIQVWEHVLKWGLAQNPDLPSTPTDFSKEDFKALRDTLQQCIPFVRFYNLTSKEFFYNVVPYRKTVPKELYMDLLKNFMDPDSEPKNKQKPRGIKETKKLALMRPVDEPEYEPEYKQLKPQVIVSENQFQSQRTEGSDVSEFTFQDWFRRIHDLLQAKEAAGRIQVWFRRVYGRRKFRKPNYDSTLDNTYNNMVDFCQVITKEKGKETTSKYNILLRGQTVNVIVELIKLQGRMNANKDKLKESIKNSSDTNKIDLCLELQDELKYEHHEKVKKALESLSITENSEKHKKTNIEWLEHELQQAENIIGEVWEWIDKCKVAVRL